MGGLEKRAEAESRLIIYSSVSTGKMQCGVMAF